MPRGNPFDERRRFDRSLIRGRRTVALEYGTCTECNREQKYDKRSFGEMPFPEWVNVEIERSSSTERPRDGLDFCCLPCMVKYFREGGNYTGEKYDHLAREL